ncbi:MAG: transglutaminase-like domain-containing protein [Rhodomicrobiaceae bacterium]
MIMDRRRFLKLGGAFAGAALISLRAHAQERFITEQGPWRKFDITTKIAFSEAKGKVQAWVPVPSVNEDDWSKALGSGWKTNAKVAKLEHDEASGADFVYFEWPEGEPIRTAEISSQASTRNRVTHFTKPGKPKPLSDDERRRYTQPTSLMPHDAQLRETAAEITGNAKTDLGKAKAIYEWIVDTKRCGLGGHASQLGSWASGPPANPDCTFLNTLYVGLARVSGLPAREIFGVRVAPSQFGYQSLGARPEDVTSKTHGWAEVWLEDYGWVPVDPGDVRRIVNDEPPGNLQVTDAKVVAARVTLFGACEANWVPYNMATDLVLPHSDGVSVPYLFRPLAWTAAGLSRDRDQPGFTYKVTAKELPA